MAAAEGEPVTTVGMAAAAAAAALSLPGCRGT